MDFIERASAGPAEAGQIRGCIDAGDGGTIKGWAFNELAPDHPLIVELYENGDKLSAGAADKHRADVAAAGFGNGLSGFEISVPRSLFDGSTHLFEVRAVAEGGIWLSLGEIEVALPASAEVFGIAPTVFPALHAQESDPEDDAVGGYRGEPEDALGEIRAAYVEDMLASALARVDELENSERDLLNERDLLRHQVAALNDHIGRELRAYGAAPHRFAPGEFDGGGVRTASVTRRRDAWLNHLSWHGVSGPIFALCPHDGQPGPLNILICGSGGIGDALYLSAVIREIALLFPSANVFVLHENNRAGDVLRANPYLSDVLCLEGSPMRSFIRGCHEFDVFDLIADVRYAVTYSTPPLSRIPGDFVRTASYRAAEWQRYVRFRWPHLNNLFAEEVVRRGMGKLDLVGWTSMLPISKASELDIFFDFIDPIAFSDLSGKPYVTIHHGADPKMVGQSGLQTKNLPIRIWADTTQRLKKAGFMIVQVGEFREELIAGVDVDLRGKASLERTAYILKGASAHLDTEGGLVHLARSVNTPSVVAFGPTPAGFFGYPQNANLAPKVCGGCWWTTDSWAQECPRGLAEPECMSSHSPRTLSSEAVRLAKQAERTLEIASFAPVSGVDELAALGDRMSSVAGSSTRGALALGGGRTVDDLEELAGVPGEVTVFVPGRQLRLGQTVLGRLGQVKAMSRGNVPVNSNSLDWAAVTGLGIGTGINETISAIVDFSRALRVEGVLFCLIDTDEIARKPETFVERLIVALAARPGARFALKALPGATAKTPGFPPKSFLLEIRVSRQETAKPPVKAISGSAAPSAKALSSTTPAKVAKAKPAAAAVPAVAPTTRPASKRGIARGKPEKA